MQSWKLTALSTDIACDLQICPGLSYYTPKHVHLFTGMHFYPPTHEVTPKWSPLTAHKFSLLLLLCVWMHHETISQWMILFI